MLATSLTLTLRIATDPEKIRTATHWEQPSDLKALQSFLGFTERQESSDAPGHLL